MRQNINTELKSHYLEDTHSLPLTGEELFEMGDIGRAELIKGKIVKMSPTGFTHGAVEISIGGILNAFVSHNGLGRVSGGEVGIYTQRNPDTIRGADVVYISNERLTKVRSESYLDVAPDLVVEVLSPSDRWTDLHDKLEEYFDIGVKSVWVADPKRREIYVHRALTRRERFVEGDVMTDVNVLPGFEVPVADLFQ